MTLYLKYRPASLNEVLGNEEVTSILHTMLDDGSLSSCPHSFLLHGPTGCGKTTLGRIIASMIGCKGNDLREVDSADFRGIDTIREICRQSQFSPFEGPCRVWLIDEAHRLTGDAQSALLKILEDTPPHVYFVLCTTTPQKLLPTIRGRCSQLQTKPLNEQQMLQLLRRVVRLEGQTLAKIVYEQIVQDSLGLPRNALQILDQVLSVPSDKRLEVAQRSAEEQSQSIELCRALMSAAGWRKISNILNRLKDQEPENIRRHILGYCESVLLKDENDLAGLTMEQLIDPLYNTGFPGLVYACYVISSDTATRRKNG